MISAHLTYPTPYHHKGSETLCLAMSDSGRGNHNKLMMYYHGSQGWEAYTVVHSTEPLDIGFGNEPQLTEGYRVFYRRPLGSGT